MMHDDVWMPNLLQRGLHSENNLPNVTSCFVVDMFGMKTVKAKLECFGDGNEQTHSAWSPLLLEGDKLLYAEN